MYSPYVKNGASSTICVSHTVHYPHQKLTSLFDSYTIYELFISISNI